MNFPNESPSFSGPLFFSWKQEDEREFTPYRPTASSPALHSKMSNSCHPNENTTSPKFKRSPRKYDVQPKGTHPKLEYLRIFKSAPILDDQYRFLKKQPSSYLLPMEAQPLLSDEEEAISIEQKNVQVYIRQNNKINDNRQSCPQNKPLKQSVSQPHLFQPQKCDTSLGFTFSLESTQSQQGEIQEPNISDNQLYDNPLQLQVYPVKNQLLSGFRKQQLQKQIIQKQMKYRELIRSCSRQGNCYSKQWLKTKMRTLLDEIYQLKKLVQY